MAGLDCLFVCLTDTWGGVEKNVLVRLEKLVERGRSVAVVIVEDTFESYFIDKNLSIYTVPKAGFFRLKQKRVLLNIFKSVKPRSVFSALKDDWWLVARLSQKFKVRKVILYLGIKRNLKENIKYRILFQFFKCTLLVNSHSLRSYVISTNKYLNEGNVRVIYNGFNIPVLTKIEPLPALKRIPPDAFIIGCMGRLAPTKRYHLLQKILAQLPSHCHVLLAGEGNERGRIQNLLMEHLQAHRVHFLGQLDYSKVPNFFKSIDVFLHVSKFEGMANVLCEALSCGVPIVSTETFGAFEATQSGKFGILTELDDIDGLSRGVKTVMNGEFSFEPELAQGWMSEQFSMQSMVDKTEKLLFE